MQGPKSLLQPPILIPSLASKASSHANTTTRDKKLRKINNGRFNSTVANALMTLFTHLTFPVRLSHSDTALLCPMQGNEEAPCCAIAGYQEPGHQSCCQPLYHLLMLPDLVPKPHVLLPDLFYRELHDGDGMGTSTHV